VNLMKAQPMYEWLKVIHILAVISWMAGLFYLPRLFVYHVDKPVGSDLDLTFQIMEWRLLAAIMRPAAVVAIVSGLGLYGVLSLGDWPLWLIIKLFAVFLMGVFHGVLERYVKLFRLGQREKSSRYFRVLNEVPTVLLVIIVIAVVVRPFS
jgi:protoporphyrinogen IX oxidase